MLADERILEDDDIAAIEESITPLVEETAAIKMVIDFERVDFLSSAVLGLLIRISRKIDHAGGQLRLCGINRNIYNIFRITRLDRVFAIHDNRQTAIESLN